MEASGTRQERWGPNGWETISEGETSSTSFASPQAKAKAEELGVNPATIEGSGTDGAITVGDVEAAASAAEPASE